MRASSLTPLASFLLVLPCCSGAWTRRPPLCRRAVFSAALSTAALHPLQPTLAKSKEKAAEKAAQKATAREAREAMKEYKFAPRPELEGDAITGYSYKPGTVKEGSIGELSGYFKEKGATIQAEYTEGRAKAVGLSTEEAKKLAEQKKKAIEAELANQKTSKKVLSDDELKIIEYEKANKNFVNNLR
mmetsp:Transcript_69180/g.114997  ORF Transcript_69180/g.114997 Transcript_69180/m.114997 type:complete len:187 (+) Transcript_69180:57-617(+)